MASDFLNKMASDRAAKIDKEYGAGSYGSSAWLEKPAAPSKSSSSGAGKKKKNKLLEWLDNHMAGDAAGDFGWDVGEQTRNFNAALAEMNTPDPIKPLPITARASSDYSSQTRGQLRNSDTIAQEAFSYFQAHPDVKVDSRTIDGWLHDNDYSGDAAKEFKAYLKKYGAGYSPLADKDTRANTFNTDDRQNKIAENVMYKNFNQEAADALLKDVDALTEAISKSFNTDRYQTADERAATAHNIDSLQECLRRLTAMGYDTSEMLGEMDSLYGDNSKLDEFYRQFTGAEQFAEWTDAQNGKVHNVGKLFVGAAHQGLEGWANGIYNLLDMVAGGNEGWAQEVWYMLGMDAITGMDDNIIHHLKNVSDAEAQSAAEYYATNASATKLSQAINEYGTAAFRMVPDFITMFLTAGTSAAATGIEGVSTVARTGGLAAYSDIATAGNRMTEATAILKSAAQDMAHSPAAITSFVQITGDSYKEALDNGSSRGEAEAYALMNGFLGTLIEVGGADEALGGIQKHLPKAVRETVANPKVSGILKTFGQSLSEGKEEVEQGVLGRLLYSEITGTPVELFSTENEDALINPNVMVKDALGGLIVGGVMTAGSLGTAAAVHAVDTKIKTAQIGDALKGKVFDTMQSLVVGTTYNKESETYKKAQSIYSKLEAADNVADAYKKIKAKDIVELRQLMETEREEYGPTAQTEADAAALTQAIHPEATVLSGTAGSLVEAGLSVEQAQKSAEVIEALARGESVSSNQINKVFLRPDSGAARAAFTEATGIEVPTGTSSDLRAFFKSVPERIKANAQSAQQIVDQAREQQAQVEEPAAEAAPTAVAPESPAVAMPIPPAAQAAQPTAEAPAAETTTPAATPIPTAAQAAAAKVKPRKKARTPAAKTRTAEVTQRTVELKNGERLDRDRFHTMMRNAIREVEGETEVTEDELDQMFEEALKLNAEAGPLDAELIELGENGGSKLSLGMLETLRDRTAVGPEAELIKLQQHIFTETERMITRFVTDTVTKYGGVKHVVIDNTLEEEANGMIQGDTMYLNPGIITNESALQMVIGHEYFHRSLAGKSTDKARHDAIDEVIDTYKDMAQRGMLSAKLERQVKGLDAKIEETRQLYHDFLISKENPSTGKQYTEDELTEMLDDYYIKEEIACDWMGIAFESSNTLARMAGVKPSVATRLVRTIRDLVDSVFGDELTKDEIELERTMKALSDELLRGLEAAAKGEAETTGPRYAIPAKGQTPTQMGPTEADAADASVITDPEGPVTTAVRDVHDAVKKFSLSSLAQASGFVAKQDEETGEVWFERNGERVDTVTVEDIDNSPIGALIDYSRDIGDFGTNRKAARQMADEQKQFFADFCTMAATTRDFQFAGSALFTALKSNSDAQYRTTYDFPSICTKTQAVIDVMSKAMVEKAKANAEKGTYEGGLTPEEIEYCYYQVHFDGNPVPCPECYVFSRWVGIGGLLDNIWNYQNVYAEMPVDAVEAEYQAMLSEMDAYAKANDINLGRAKGSLAKKYSKKYEDLKEKIEKADNQGEKVKDTDRQALRLMELKMNTVKAMTWIDKVYFGGKAHTKASPRRFVPADVLFNLNDGNTFATDYPEAWGFRCTQGAGYGKAIAPYAEAVVGEGILGTANTNATLKSKKDGTLVNPFIDSSKIDLNDKNKAGRTKKLESARKKQLTQAFIGGQRFSSTSDARFENATDFLIAALEVQAMHGMVQVYTKVPGAVPVYDRWGFSSNMSLMPKGSGLDAQGRPVDTSVGGMNPQVARELRDEYEYQGTITIGLNDNHIRKLFNQTWRDFIIPYHASGGKAELVASFRSIQDNGDVNNVHSTDYTRVQGEKVLSDEVLRWQGKSDKEIERIHANREARLAILTGKGTVDMSVVNKNPYLKELYSRLHGKWKGVQLTRGVCEKQIFPNEYWDESVSYEDSKKITTDYLAYCESLGMLHKFSGMVPSNGKLIIIKGYDENGARVPLTDLAYKYDKEGNKTEEVEDYFWKVLTDRRMFGNQGQYLPQRFVNLTGTTTAEMMDFGTTNRFGERAGRQYDPTKAAQTAEVVAQNIVNGTVPELKNSPLRAAAEKKAKKDDKKYSLSDFKPKANTEGMTAISEAIMHIEEINRFTGKEFVDIYKKYPAVNFIERFIAGDPTVVRDLKMSIEGADYIALDKLKYYPVHALPSSFRKAHRGAITKYNKIFNEAIENAFHADKPIVGRDLGIKSGEVSLTRLEELFNELNSNDEIEELARKVFNFVRENPEIARNIKFKRIGSDPFDRRTMGLQFGDKVRYDTTYFNSPYLTDQKKAGTILHELIHASTVYALEGYNLGWYMDNPPLEDACKAIYDVYSEIQDAPEMVNADGKRFYGCTNAKEMVAELANPEFRLALKKKNLWERLVDAIKRLLGIEPGNAYDAVNRAFDQLLENYDYGLERRYIRAAMNSGSRYNNFSEVETETTAAEEEIFDAGTRYSLRTEAPPKKTQWGFKLMTVDADGKPHAMFIDSEMPYEIGEWYNADSPNLDDLKDLEPGFTYLIGEDGKIVEDGLDFIDGRGRPQHIEGRYPILHDGKPKLPPKGAVKAATGIGARWMRIDMYSANQQHMSPTNDGKRYSNVGIGGGGSVSTFAIRPGIHAVDIPSMAHIGAENEQGEIDRRRPDQRWFLIEYPVDQDYNQEAFGNRTKDIRNHLPTDGWYSFQTNSGAEKRQHWFITGAMKIVGAVSEKDVRAYTESKGFEQDLEWKDGKVYDDAADTIDLMKYAEEHQDTRTPSKAEMREKIEAGRKGDKKYSLGDGYVESGNSARMTNDRIDYLIEDSGAGRKKDYAQMWITSINPTDFINLTTGKIQDRELFDKYPGDYGTTVDEYDFIDGLKKNMRQTPYLNIDAYGNVIGHEGRHRMRALERKGITSAEIVVRFYDEGSLIKNVNVVNGRLETLDTAIVTNQMGTGQTATLTNLIPVNLDHKEEILQSYGEGHAAEGDIRYSLDSEYLELAKDPEKNREQLQAMVDEAAKRAGYDSPRLYHGTHSFGFTKFDLDMMDDKSTIFLTDNEYVAESYGGTLDKKDVSGRPFDPMTASDEEVLRRYNELNSHRQAAKIYTPDEVADLRAEYLSEIRKSSEAVQKLYQAMQNVEFRDALGLTDSDLQTVYALNTAAKSIATDGAADDLLYVDGLISSIMRTMSTNLSRSYGIMVPSEGFANSIRMLAVLNGITTNNEKVVITEKHGFAQTMKQVRRQLADNLIAEADQGIYSLYVNTDNLFEIECNGDLWDEIDVPKELREYVPVGANELVNTRRIAAAAKEAGYDGVIFRDIVDVGADAYDYYESDVYAIYDPGRAKSADPVTYDDNGNVIPLSERFSPENDDIRYSLKQGEKPTAETKRTVLTGSSVGTILSRVRGNTFAYSKFFNETELMMQGLREEDMTYNPVSEAESMRQAESRLRADYAGEKKNLGAAGKAWSGADLDTAMGILSNELAKARATDSEKSYDEVVRWAQMIRLKGTQAGQMIQAFAKYTRTPEGVLVRAVDDLDKTNLDKDQKKELLNKVRDFANTLSAIKDGDKAGLIEIILRQAKQRNTKVSSATRKALEKQEFTYLYNTAITQLDQITKDYISASAGKKIATYQTISHLLNLRTAGRNVISNTVFNFIDTVANNIAVVPDLMMSIISGKRTVGLESSLTKSAREGAKAGRAKAQIEIALDVAPDDSRDKYGTARRTWKMVGNPGAKVMSSLEKAMGFELNYTDESAKGRIRGMVMQSLKPFVEKGWMTVEEAESLAEQEALYRTFQDDTLLSRFMGDMKKAFNVFGFGGQRSTEYEDQIARGNKVKRAIDKNTHDFGLGDIVLKYTQVPGALLTRAFEYSPVGAAKALRNIGLFVSSKHALNQQAKAAQQTIEKYREAAEAGDAVAQEMIRRAEAKLRKAEIKLTRDQHMAALQMSRAFTGTGLITLFAMAALKGVMSRADDEGDADAKSLLNSQGISGTQLNLDALVRMMNGESTEWREGDVLAAVDFLEPLNSLMTMGAMVAKSDECQSVWDMYKNPDLLFNRGAANALYYSIGELSVMQTLQTIQNSAQYYDPDSGIPQWLTTAIDVARGSATGFIPGPVRQLGQAMDPYYRDTYSSKDIGDRFRDSIWGALPGARETLPIKQTPLGEDKMQEEQPLRAINAFLMPGSLRTYRETAMTKELERVYEASGATNIFPDRNAPYKVNVPGSEYELGTAARRQYQLTRGNEYTQAVGAMMNSDAYKSADAVTQGELLAKAKSFANYLAKKEVDGANGGSYTDAEMENYIAARDATGMSIADYYQARGPLSDIKSDKKPDGKTIRDSRKPKVIDYINGLDYLTPEQKTYIFAHEYSSYLNDDGSYKNTIYELPWN